MATTLQEYISMSDPSYAARRQGIQNQINDINPQKQAALTSAQEQYSSQLGTLDRQKEDYGLDARNSAASRGLAWSNVADNYRSNYEKNNYTPAATNLSNALNSQNRSIEESYTNRQRGLEDALNSLTNEQHQYAQNLWQADKDRAAQLQAQRDAAAIQANSLASYYVGQQAKAAPSMGFGSEFGVNNDPNGIYFYDANGSPIKAAAYAAQSGQDIRDLLALMIQRGDNNARFALAGLNNAKKQLTNEERSAFGTLGIDTSGYGSRL